MLNTRKNKRTQSRSSAREIDATTQDFSSDFEQPIAILEDLMMIAMEEIGNGGGRALSILLPAMRYVHDLKAINHRLLDVERTR
jgi:hypothetical protein